MKRSAHGPALEQKTIPILSKLCLISEKWNYNLRQTISKAFYFRLIDDIVYDDKQDNNYYPSIASEKVEFQGVFDGYGHAIRGIRINRKLVEGSVVAENYELEIFGSIGKNGVVKNLIVKNTKIHAYAQSGIIANYCAGTIENCLPL